jgi:dephospho-CoA kinase
VARVLVTGMSGTGKSTVLEELRRRGYHTVDTDYGDWQQAGLWDASRMAELLARHPDVVVAGTAENQGEFYDRFQHVVLLSVPAGVILERVRHRTNNPYGKSSEQQAEILGYVETVEPLLRAGATLELDGRASVEELASVFESLMRTQEP